MSDADPEEHGAEVFYGTGGVKETAAYAARLIPESLQLAVTPVSVSTDRCVL